MEKKRELPKSIDQDQRTASKEGIYLESLKERPYNNGKPKRKRTTESTWHIISVKTRRLDRRNVIKVGNTEFQMQICLKETSQLKKKPRLCEIFRR